MPLYSRTYNPICPGDLIAAINADAGIVVDCVQIINNGGSPVQSDFDFASTLSGPQETAFDNLLATFTCPVDNSNPVDEQDFTDTNGPDSDVIWSSERVAGLYQMENLGAGNGIFVQRSGDGTGSPHTITFEMKSLEAGTNVTITPSGTTLTIASTGGGGATALNDLTDVDLTGSPLPGIGDVLTYNGSEWVQGPIESGSEEKVLNSWTLLSGNLYYNDFVHNLDTTKIAVFLRETATDISVRPEYYEIISSNTIRVVVEGNSENLTCNVVTGRGPAGPSGGGGTAWGAISGTLSDQTDLQTALDGKAASSHTHVKADITDFAHTHVEADITDLGSYIENVVEDTTPQLGGDLDMNLNNIQYTVPTGDLTTSGIIVSATVDTNSVGVGATLYMAADGNFDQTDADSASTMPCRALAAESGTGTKKVLLQGFLRKNAWNWTVGGDLYISTTSGTLTQTPPSGSGDQVQKVGFAWTADIIYFNPGDYTIVEVA